MYSAINATRGAEIAVYFVTFMVFLSSVLINVRCSFHHSPRKVVCLKRATIRSLLDWSSKQCRSTATTRTRTRTSDSDLFPLLFPSLITRGINMTVDLTKSAKENTKQRQFPNNSERQHRGVRVNSSSENKMLTRSGKFPQEKNQKKAKRGKEGGEDLICSALLICLLSVCFCVCFCFSSSSTSSAAACCGIITPHLPPSQINPPSLSWRIHPHLTSFGFFGFFLFVLFGDALLYSSPPLIWRASRVDTCGISSGVGSCWCLE